MKTIYISIISIVLGCFIFSSCNDFLERPPLDSLSDTEYWKKEEHARTFAKGFYTTLFAGYGSGVSHGPFLLGQSLNDDFTINNQADFSPLVIPTSDGGWNFQNIRKSNYMIEKVEGMKALVGEEAYKHWKGIGHFFRASMHANLSFVYGDIPYFDRVPDLNEKEYLYKPRDPRSEIALKNIEDFQFAIDNTRENDGSLQINKYVIAAYASRLMLREGTFLKYHNIDLNVAEKCLEFAKRACELVMSGPYAVSDDYKALFTSEDLESNREVIFYRKYIDGILMHSTLAYSNTDAQAGPTKSLAVSFLTSEGLPVYSKDANWMPKNSVDFFKDRDPRLAQIIRSQYYVRGENNSPFAYSLSGYSWSKFMDDKYAGSTDQKFTREKNITAAPCLRLGEVLLNYAEICYELGDIKQEDLDKSINLLRSRKGMELPHLEIIGGQPAVNGQIYDDPKRDPEIPALLWEIRRERRVELCYEGVRLNDLKRWKKLDYLYNEANPDIRYGAYIRYVDYKNVNKTEVVFDTAGAVEGYILTNKGNQRKAPLPRNYVNPVPSDQIQLYEDNGYVLTQTKEWNEN